MVETCRPSLRYETATRRLLGTVCGPCGTDSEKPFQGRARSSTSTQKTGRPVTSPGKGIPRMLRGNSGCRLELVRSATGTEFVRKSAASIDYNVRLMEQMTRQESFQHSGVNTPEILGSGFSPNGTFFFDMQFIPGRGLHESIASGDNVEIQQYARAMSRVIVEFASIGTSEQPTGTVEAKIHRLEELLLPTTEVDVSNALHILKATRIRMPQSSKCHGDMTLENVIVMRDKLYLIDFHDIFFSSWMQDVAKLQLDLDAEWSMRHQPREPFRVVNTRIALQRFRTHLTTLLSEQLTIGDEERRVIEWFTLFHLLRMLPYTSEPQWRRQLIRQLGKVSGRLLE